jgi:hypothetical protein
VNVTVVIAPAAGAAWKPDPEMVNAVVVSPSSTPGTESVETTGFAVTVSAKASVAVALAAAGLLLSVTETLYLPAESFSVFPSLTTITVADEDTRVACEAPILTDGVRNVENAPLMSSSPFHGVLGAATPPASIAAGLAVGVSFVTDAIVGSATTWKGTVPEGVPFPGFDT